MKIYCRFPIFGPGKWRKSPWKVLEKSWNFFGVWEITKKKRANNIMFPIMYTRLEKSPENDLNINSKLQSIGLCFFFFRQNYLVFKGLSSAAILCRSGKVLEICSVVYLLININVWKVLA